MDKNTAFHILFTVTNDLNFDQRMVRICTSLHHAGYQVTLIGSQLANSLPLVEQPYTQIRIPIKVQKGKAFYASFNYKLLRCLQSLPKPTENKKTAVCAIDLDTVLPVWYYCKQHHLAIPVYDAHEFFTEMVEVNRRKIIKAIWTKIEQKTIPTFKHGYAVNETLAQKFKNLYGHNYQVIRNLPSRKTTDVNTQNHAEHPALPPEFILYQGAVNEGRAFEELIPAMTQIDLPLVIVGNGNFYPQVQTLIQHYGLEHKVIMLGKILPTVLQLITPKAALGLTLFTPHGQNQYYSLANRFFDYIQAEIPQVCVKYPEYEAINEKYQIAAYCHEVTPKGIADAVNNLLHNTVLYKGLQQNCKKAAAELSWEHEAVKLIDFYKLLFA